MDYPREIDNYKIGKLNLKVIAVDHGFAEAHKLDFLRQNEDFFKKEINSPKYVFFEMGLGKDQFYQGLAELLNDKDKSIYVPDALERRYAFQDVAIGVAGVGIFGFSLKGLISRRNFLKDSAMALLGLYLSTGTMGAREDMLDKIVGKDGTLDNKLSFDTVQDFRNIVSVDNIFRAESELGFEGDATYFIGYRHLNGLRAYINNPDMRRKRKLYSTQESFLTKKIKEYKKIEGSWKIVNAI